MFLALATFSYAGPREVVLLRGGFMTGNSYQQLNNTGKKGYAMGFYNGLLMAPAFGAHKEETKWVEECVSLTGDGQIVAIIDKFLQENPARWHEPMNILSYAALKASCEK
jgi:hypothetical protein